MTTRKRLGLAFLVASVLALGGCSNPDAPAAERSQTQPVSPGGVGEPAAPAPPTPAAQAPTGVRSSPRGALRAFAELYINWSYRTLSVKQRTLAAMSVGAARLAEQQAAASSQGDDAISRGEIHNSGQVLAIAVDLTQPGTWVLATREQTGGSSQYQGLPAGYHVTLARLASVPGGYAVSEWLPQS